MPNSLPRSAPTRSRTAAVLALSLAGVALASRPAHAQNDPCRDPWVSRAVREVAGRAPNGSGDGGECDFRRYGGGSWSSYPDLVGKVRATFAANAPASAGTSEAAARGAVTRSYRAALQRDPKPDELAYWLPRAVRENLNADAMTRLHAEWGAGEVYRRVLGRAPNGAEVQAFVGGTMGGGMSVDRLWTQLMSSDEYRGRNGGRNGPVNTEFVSYQKNPQLNQSGQPTAAVEQCFGAIGQKCDGYGPAGSTPRWSGHFTRADGVEMAYVEIETSVGSIAHDNACRNIGAAGTWCNGNGVWDETFNRAGPASREWKKAVYNSLPTNKRYWKETFGPYPTNPTLRAKYSDDLTPAPARSTVLPAPMSGAVLMDKYQFDETRETRRLGAPAGQALDTTDGEFCKSGGFQGGTMPGGWGTCR